MDLSNINVLETAGAVAITVALVSAVKQTGINGKFLPLIALAVGIIVVWVGGMAGLLPFSGAAVIWNGIITGIMATGGWSGVKNVLEGMRGGVK